MTERPTKDKRITIRLPDDLHAWVEEQAEANGLDSAAFVRMRLKQLQARGSQNLMMAPMVAETEPEAILPDRMTYAPAGEGENAPNPDDLVRQALATAEATGAAQPQQPEDEYPEFGGSVRPVSQRKTWDPYHAKDRARA